MRRTSAGFIMTCSPGQLRTTATWPVGRPWHAAPPSRPTVPAGACVATVRSPPSKVPLSVNIRNLLPVEDALLGCAAHVGAQWRPQHHEPALVADLANLLGAHVGRIGAAIDTGGEPFTIECVSAGVGVVLADLASVRPRLVNMTRPSGAPP